MFNSLAMIGITVNASGKMSITDSTTLTNAIANNSSDVAAIFSDTTDGVGLRLKNYLDYLNLPGAMLPNTIDTVDAQMQQIHDRINQKESAMLVYENRLRLQYSALSALLSANSSLIDSLKGFSVMPTIGG